MRSELQIQEAHDILVAVILKQVDLGVSLQAKSAIIAAASALCWVLEHDHNLEFPRNLAHLRAEAEKRGFVLGRRNN